MPAEKPATVPALITLPGAILISIITLAAGVGIGWANLKGQVDEIPALKVQVAENEKALSKLDVMANDIAWIKQELVRQNRDASRTNSRTPGGGSP